MKVLKPDAVYIIGVPIEVGNFLKQSLELNFRPTMLMNNMDDPNLINIAGSAAEGIFFVIPFFDIQSHDSITQKFVNKFREKYNCLPDMFAADAYDAVFLVKLSIENGGYTSDGIKEALYKIKDYHGVDGTITFDKNGDVIKVLTIKTVRDGQFVVYH